MGEERGEHPIIAHEMIALTSGNSDSKGKYLLVCPQEIYNLPYSTPAR